MWDLFFGELFLLLIVFVVFFIIDLVFLVIRLLKDILYQTFLNSFGEVNDRGRIGVCGEIN